MTYLFLLLVALFAWAEAKRDARLIREGKPIDHKKRWRLRAGLVCIGAILPTGPYECKLNWLILIKWTLLCIAAGALFSACFRMFLNKRRGKHWAYISPSNWYDSMFLFIAGDGALSKGKKRQGISHQAGRLAFICELLLTLAALVAVSKL